MEIDDKGGEVRTKICQCIEGSDKLGKDWNKDMKVLGRS
jgi:hypothetical protein